jgi:hypothetical protein
VSKVVAKERVILGGKEYEIEYVQPSAEESRAYGVYQDAMCALDKHLLQAIAGALEDLDPPSYLPMREPLPPRVQDLNPDDEYRAGCVAATKVIPFFPDGAIAIVLHALHRCGITRRNVRVEWLAEHATVIAYVTGIEPSQTDAIMSAAIPMMPQDVGIDVRIEHGPSCGCDDCEEERNR